MLDNEDTCETNFDYSVTFWQIIFYDVPKNQNNLLAMICLFSNTQYFYKSCDLDRILKYHKNVAICFDLKETVAFPRQ